MQSVWPFQLPAQAHKAESSHLPGHPPSFPVRFRVFYSFSYLLYQFIQFYRCFNQHGAELLARILQNIAERKERTKTDQRFKHYFYLFVLTFRLLFRFTRADTFKTVTGIWTQPEFFSRSNNRNPEPHPKASILDTKSLSFRDSFYIKPATACAQCHLRQGFPERNSL